MVKRLFAYGLMTLKQHANSILAHYKTVFQMKTIIRCDNLSITLKSMLQRIRICAETPPDNAEGYVMDTVGWLSEQLRNLKVWREELLNNPCDQAISQVEQLVRHQDWLESQLEDLQMSNSGSLNP